MDVGGNVQQLSLSSAFSCALLEDGTVRCWGSGGNGQLGYGDTNDVSDDIGETPAGAGPVPLGGDVVHIDSSVDHSCAALEDGTVRCWGAGGAKLGYGDGDTGEVGAEQTPAQRGVVDVGGRAIQVAVGGDHSCALLEGGDVRCWGAPTMIANGEAFFPIGDNEAPSTTPITPLGGRATHITAGDLHTCALLEDMTVRCWGVHSSGQLGYGDEETVGDNETPAERGAVDVGGDVLQISAGDRHTCAVLTDRTVRCWGQGTSGRLGYGNTDHIGDNETPGSLPDPVDVGGDVEFIAAGGHHTCAFLTTGALRCWGLNSEAALGYDIPTTENIGDDEHPASAGDVPWLQ